MSSQARDPEDLSGFLDLVTRTGLSIDAPFSCHLSLLISPDTRKYH